MLDPINSDPVKRPSERSFGLTIAAALLLTAFLPVLWHASPRLWSLGLAVVFGLLAWFAPRRLASLNLIWFRFGLLLHKIVNPTVMAVIYCILIWPAGIFMRMAGVKPLRLGREADLPSYWIKREFRGPSPDSFKYPF